MSNEREKTIRQEIISLLEKGPRTIREISQSVHIMEKDVSHHLVYIEKTARRQNKRIYTNPCQCLDCGFQFKARKSFKKPSKCPGCRDGRMAPSVFWISSLSD